MPRTIGLLSVDEHSRDSVGKTYVYPVVSRRAGGVSVGINLNPNNACNWQCVYCQVPDLVRGGPPPIDLTQLAGELDGLLTEIISGDFMQEHVPDGLRQLQDIAFSGNGEPTSAAEFADAVKLVVNMLPKHDLVGKIKLRLITNGSQIGRLAVQDGLRVLGNNNGEVWFKLDAATNSGIAHINGVRISPEAHVRRLRLCAGLCPTWVQSCFFAYDGEVPAAAELDAYVDTVGKLSGVVAGVHLYGLARTSMQPGAGHLSRLPGSWFDTLAARLKKKGLDAIVSP